MLAQQTNNTSRAKSMLKEIQLPEPKSDRSWAMSLSFLKKKTLAMMPKDRTSEAAALKRERQP